MSKSKRCRYTVLFAVENTVAWVDVCFVLAVPSGMVFSEWLTVFSLCCLGSCENVKLLGAALFHLFGHAVFFRHS